MIFERKKLSLIIFEQIKQTGIETKIQINVVTSRFLFNCQFAAGFAKLAIYPISLRQMLTHNKM